MKKSFLPWAVALTFTFPLVSQAHPLKRHSLNKNSIYQATSAWTDQSGKNVKRSSLQGHPVVVSMIYTSCGGVCPMTISDLKKIDGKLSSTTRNQVRFALFSFDSQRDTPAALAKFAKSRNLDLKRWTLFNGKPDAVRELAALLGIQYKKTSDGDFDHSTVITVLDRDGVIRAQQNELGKDPQPIVKALEAAAQGSGD